MRLCNFVRPRVEALETRWVPAILLQLDSSGNLTGIFGVPDGNVELTFTADDEVNVVEDGNDLGTYSVVGDLRAVLGNTVEALTHTVDLGGFSMGGSLSITLGNSSAVTTLDLLNGTVSGNLTVRTGNGQDVVTATGLTVEGSGNFNTQSSLDSLAVDGTTFAGNLTVAGVQDFDLTGSTVEGVFSFNSRLESLATTIDIDAASVIEGIASISTGAGADVVTVDGTINSHAIFKLAAGANELNINDTAVILGNTVVSTTAGADTVNLAAAILGGSFTATTGAGDDTVTFDGTTVLGSMITYVGGNGADTLTVTSAGLIAPGARLTFHGLNGNDTVNFDDATAIDLLFAYLDGGFGFNVFNSTGTISFPIVLRNFV